ncbi:hypothetical protein [Anaerosacchariphilus polymeriproducens]|uniref:Uncharacterized protein n=1 Tax=Anaerosacchariphilus polymeriproducens TaxID=1812858 RepID=A0A371AWH1_9FIRM|nr:hypothetical protein [Anaerosacchariphilus polymeriproducens]RDU23891.1 hypothetical protein DWV06_06230 [Anaerosacchariphilus polymeriproducens]
MKHIKRILALIGLILLLGLYLLTFIFALFDNDSTKLLFKASLFSTIAIPTLIYIYTYIYKLIKKYYGKDKENIDNQK